MGSSADDIHGRILLVPNCPLGPAKLAKLDGAQRCFCDREELVELRWRRRGTAEHCVRLATMTDLVLEKMQQAAEEMAVKVTSQLGEA